ncbi:hypothetical protein GCM10010269_72350 [Streptomyces humidus]|uniref:Alpha/beta hydrolase n=1 Tax=Streptomyces humidus TaxID=52259 RepID=A0A918G7R1_9ACTN|nr:hypothetical protein GCM10010269_72350 [Streptomyces humidus]
MVRHGTSGLSLGLRSIMHPSRTAMVIGHSLGRAATAETMCAGLPFTAGVNLDGALFGEGVTRVMDRPLIVGRADRPDDPPWLSTRPRLGLASIRAADRV